MSRLDAPLEQAQGGTMRAHFGALPVALAERLAARGLEGTVRLAFEGPAPTGVETVTRSHPLPATLADALLESALDPGSAALPAVGRAGAWPTSAIKVVTTVALIRLRFKLIVTGRHDRFLLAEEAGALAWQAGSAAPVLAGEEARALLEHAATGNLDAVARRRVLTHAGDRVRTALAESLADYAQERAKILGEDHAAVRAAATGSARVTIEPVLPPDIIALYVLVPAMS